ITSLAVSNEGRRAYGFADGHIELRAQGGAVTRTLSLGAGPVTAVSLDGATLMATSATELAWFDLAADGAGAARRRPLPAKPTALASIHGTAVIATGLSVIIDAGPAAAARTIAI